MKGEGSVRCFPVDEDDHRPLDAAGTVRRGSPTDQLKISAFGEKISRTLSKTCLVAPLLSLITPTGSCSPSITSLTAFLQFARLSSLSTSSNKVEFELSTVGEPGRARRGGGTERDGTSSRKKVRIID